MNSLKICDYLIIFFFLLLAIFLFLNNIKSNQAKYVEIKTPYKIIKIKLPTNKKIAIKGEIGYLIIQIKNKKVRVIKSSCPLKICVKTGWISSQGESIICVPNKVIIKIIGGKNKKKDIDFITK